MSEDEGRKTINTAAELFEATATARALAQEAVEAVAEATRAAFARPLFDAEALRVYAKSVIDVQAFAKPLFDIDCEGLKAVRELQDGIARLVEAGTPDLDNLLNFRDFDFEPMSLPPMRSDIDELRRENAERRQENAELRRRVSALEMKGIFPDDADFPH